MLRDLLLLLLLQPLRFLGALAQVFQVEPTQSLPLLVLGLGLLLSRTQLPPLLLLPAVVVGSEGLQLLLELELLLPAEEPFGLFLGVLDLFLDPEVDFPLDFVEEVLLLPEEVALGGLDLPLLVDLGDDVVVDLLDVGLADPGELDAQSFEVLQEGLAPADVDLVEVEELLVGLVVADDAVVEAQRLLIVQADLLHLQLEGLLKQAVGVVELLDHL